MCRVETIEAARRLGFIGSPTIRIAGRDPFAQPDAVPALACRLYSTPEGLTGAPITAQLVAVLAKGSGPGGSNDIRLAQGDLSAVGKIVSIAVPRLPCCPYVARRGVRKALC